MGDVCCLRDEVLCVCMCACGAAYGQVQSFVVRPTDVIVVQGQTAILHCQVAHMKGQLQWTKNGFALGALLMPASTNSSLSLYTDILHE